MKILIAGDTHGNLKHLEYLLQVSQDHHVDRIVQIGDFGFFWPGKPIQPVLTLLKKYDIDLYFLDGNHDDFDELERRGVFQTCGDIQPIAPKLFYIPRGCTWTWDDKKFLGLGGAFSVDIDHRVQGVSWWPQETLKTSEVIQIVKAIETRRDIDVILSHDTPEGIPFLEGYLAGFTLREDLERRSRANRRAVRYVFDVVHPSLLIHGHYHVHYEAEYEGAKILGLDRDGTKEKSWTIMALDKASPVCNDGAMPA